MATGIKYMAVERKYMAVGTQYMAMGGEYMAAGSKGMAVGSLSALAKSRGFCSSSSFPAPHGGARKYMAIGSKYMAMGSTYMAMGSECMAGGSKYMAMESECMAVGSKYMAVGSKYMAVGSLSALAKSRGFSSSSSFPAPYRGTSHIRNHRRNRWSGCEAMERERPLSPPPRSTPRSGAPEREFFINNLLVRIHLIIEMVLVDRPCVMSV